MPNKRDISGNRYGNLVAVRCTDERKNGAVAWECKCDCGNKITVRLDHLTLGRTISCGCVNRSNSQSKIKKHNADNQVEGTDLKILLIKIPKLNTSGVKGVYWNAEKQKWHARITFQCIKRHIGYFDKLEDAAQARKEAEEKYFRPVLEKYGRLEEVKE